MTMRRAGPLLAALTIRMAFRLSACEPAAEPIADSATAVLGVLHQAPTPPASETLLPADSCSHACRTNIAGGTRAGGRSSSPWKSVMSILMKDVYLGAKYMDGYAIESKAAKVAASPEPLTASPLSPSVIRPSPQGAQSTE